jgi:hypothetical protein
MMRKLSSKERLRVMWDHVGPKLTIVKVAEHSVSHQHGIAASLVSELATTPEPSIAGTEGHHHHGLVSPRRQSPLRRVLFWRGDAAAQHGGWAGSDSRALAGWLASTALPAVAGCCAGAAMKMLLLVRRASSRWRWLPVQLCCCDS